MKTVSKLLTAVMVLALLAMPMAGLAESAAAASGEQVTLSLENVVLGIGEGSPVTMDFTGLKGELTFGLGEGRGMMAGKILANDEDVISGAAAMEEGKLTGVLNGLNKAFQISEADLSAIMGASAESAAAAEQMSGFFSALGAYMSKENMEALEKEAQAAMGDITQFKGFTEAGEEEIELFGEKMTAKKYDVNMTAEDFKALMDKSMEVVMNNEGYKKLLDAANKLVGEEAQINEETMSKMMDAVYSDIAITGTAWQADEEHMKLDLDYKVTIDPAKLNEAVGVEADLDEEALKPQTLSYKMVMDAAGNQVDGVITMDMGEEGKADITLKNTETASDAASTNTFEMGMNVNAEGETVQMTLSGDETVGQDGAYGLNLGLSASDGTNEVMSLGMNYNGTKTEADGATTHAGTLSLSMGGMGQVFSVSGDVAMTLQALPEGKLLDVTGMEVVDPLTLTEAQQTELAAELQSVLMNGLVKLRNVPALSDLLGSAMSSEVTTEAAAEPVTDGAAEAPAAEPEATPEADEGAAA